MTQSKVKIQSDSDANQKPQETDKPSFLAENITHPSVKHNTLMMGVMSVFDNREVQDQVNQLAKKLVKAKIIKEDVIKKLPFDSIVSAADVLGDDGVKSGFLRKLLGKIQDFVLEVPQYVTAGIGIAKALMTLIKLVAKLLRDVNVKADERSSFTLISSFAVSGRDATFKILDEGVDKKSIKVLNRDKRVVVLDDDVIAPLLNERINNFTDAKSESFAKSLNLEDLSMDSFKRLWDKV